MAKSSPKNGGVHRLRTEGTIDRKLSDTRRDPMITFDGESG
jgi:hypothetical protein